MWATRYKAAKAGSRTRRKTGKIFIEYRSERGAYDYLMTPGGVAGERAPRDGSSSSSGVEGVFSKNRAKVD